MSTNTQVAVLASLRRDAGPRRSVARANDRPIVRLVAFAALGLYGVTRWGTLMHPGFDAAAARAAGDIARAGRDRAGAARARAHGGGDARPFGASVCGWRAARVHRNSRRVPDQRGAPRLDDSPARGRHRERNRPGAVGAARHPGSVQRDQRLGPDGDPAGCRGAAARCRDAAGVRAARARRHPPSRRRAAVDRARGRAGDARPPEPSLPARAAAVRADRALHVGRARAVRPPRRGAARVRGDRRRRDGDRAGAQAEQPVDRLRGADPRLHARARRAVRLDPAVRAADLAAHRQHRARGEVRSDSVERRVLEDREPRLVRWRGVGRGRRHRGPGSAEQRAARRKRGDDQALHAEPDRDDPRDEDHADHRRRVRVGASSTSRARRCRATASAPG